VDQAVKEQIQRRDISYVSWSAKGIRVVYTGAMVVNLSAEDMFPLAIRSKVETLVASERKNMAVSRGGILGIPALGPDTECPT
jgi:hypothetical protein